MPQFTAVTGALVIAVGTVVLATPLCSSDSVGLWEALFTVTSAITVTGLSIIDVGKELTFVGQVVLAGLILTGGLGLMAITTFLQGFVQRQAGLQRRLDRGHAMDEFGVGGIGDTFHQILATAAVVNTSACQPAARAASGPAVPSPRSPAPARPPLASRRVAAPRRAWSATPATLGRSPAPRLSPAAAAAAPIRLAARSGDVKALERIYTKHLKTPIAKQEMDELSMLIKKAGPVCILCYERDHRDCHRTFIAEIIEERDGVAVKNLVAPQM